MRDMVALTLMLAGIMIVVATQAITRPAVDKQILDRLAAIQARVESCK